MKLTAEQKARFKALLAKAEGARTADESTELKSLQDLATKEGYNPNDDEAMSAEDVRKLVDDGVKDGVTKALTALNLDKSIVDAVGKSLEGKQGITPALLDEAIKKHLGGNTPLDTKALAEEVKKHLTPTAGITQTQLDTALETFGKSIRQPSRHEFGAGGGEAFPVEHRSGNLSVAQKQLLNICLMNVTKDALEKSNGGKGINRPTGMDDGIPAEILRNAQARGASVVKSLRTALSGKAITTGGSGTGLELVNTDLSSELMARFYLESQLATELMASEIDMPSDPFKLPMVTTRPTFYQGSEAPGSDPTASTPGTQNPTLDSKKIIGLVEYSYEADEDSVVAILPLLQAGLSSGAADAFEGALLSGDTTATHQDSDIHAVSAHAAKSFDGLRKLALGVAALKVSLATGGISAANFLSLKKAMLKYGVRPRDLIAVVGVKGYNDIVGLEETLTADKVGSNLARILTGDAPSLYGVRIITSAQCREDLNASGVYDGVTTDKGSLLILHKPSWMVGVRRGFTVEVDTDKKRQINSLVASFRRAFIPLETPSAAQAIVALGYNYNS